MTDEHVTGPLNEDDVMLFLANEHAGRSVPEIAAVAASWATVRHYLFRRPGVSAQLLVLRLDLTQSLRQKAEEILYAMSMVTGWVQVAPAPDPQRCTVTPAGHTHLRARGLLT